MKLLKQSLERLIGWMGANKFKLNLRKMEVLLGGSDLALGSECILRLAGFALTPKLSDRTLAILLDPGRLVHEQISIMAEMLQTPVALLDKKERATVTYALVTSWLDYCHSLYMGLPLRRVRKLQLVQNTAIHMLIQVF